MNDHDSATIVITFLLLLPWLGRAAVSAMEVWRARTESQTKKAKINAHNRLRYRLHLARRTTADRMGAHRKSDRRRDALACAFETSTERPPRSTRDDMNEPRRSQSLKRAIKHVDQKIGVVFFETHRRRETDCLSPKTAFAYKQAHLFAIFHDLRAFLTSRLF
jgi:hypothetical protein